MNILVTGGSGFVGNAAAFALMQAGHIVVLALRGRSGTGTAPEAARTKIIPPIETMTVEDWLPLLEDIDAVVHCAAIAHIGTSVDSARYDAVNRDASHRLATAAARSGVQKFVFLSSIRAQVGATSSVVQNEATLPSPAEAYGRSKLEAEGLIRAVLPQTTVLRPSLVVGPEARGNLELLVKAAQSGLPLPLGRFVRPQAMVSLEGLVLAITMAVTQPQFIGQTVVLADDPHPTLADMLAWIRDGLGKPRRIFAMPEAMFAQPLTLMGKGDAFGRMAGGLQVDSTLLRTLGWHAPLTPQQAFTTLGQMARR